ncbi:hypothetical protein LCGC14_2531220 [marine sediment metagenome]|uniref:Major capsid protein n=1 Tax=marine sediment metagenome TaxID=412755 RepID=A0A0F9BGC2_9ZZZZ
MPRTSPQLTSRTLPTVQDVHVDRLLQNLSIAYRPQGMVAEEVLPIIPVVHESDIYTVWDVDDMGRLSQDGKGGVVADGDEPDEIIPGRQERTYRTKKYAYSTQVTDRERGNVDTPLTLELVKVNFAQDLLTLEREKRVADLLATMTELAVANGAWDSSDSSDPEQEFDLAKDQIRLATNGRFPTEVVVPHPVALHLKRHSLVRDLLRFTQSNLLVNGDLPPTIWNTKVHIPTAVRTSTAEGQATQTHVNVWSATACFFLIKGPTALNTVTTAAIIRKGFQVVRWRWNHRSTEYISPQVLETEELIATASGLELTGCVSA